MSKPPPMSTAAVAARLKVTTRTVHRFVDDGRLTPILRGAGIRGPMWFAPDDVDTLAQELDKPRAS